MRIVMVNPHLGAVLGGLQRDMLRLASELAAEGDEVGIVTTFDEFPVGRVDLNQAGTWERPGGIEVVRLDGRMRGRLRNFQPANPPLVLPGLAAAVRHFRPDAVVFYNVGWPLTVLPALLALRRQTRVLYRTAYHGYDGAHPLDPLRRRLQLGVAGLSHRLLTYSHAEKAQIVQQGGINPDKIVPVYPGVEVPELAQEEINAFRSAQGLEGAVVIAHVARLGRFKGTDRLIRALPGVQRQSGRDVVLLLAGRNLEADYLNELVQDLDLAGHIRFLGPLPERDLHAAYAASDIFVLPSRYESFGLVYLEAMAHGLPVVGVRTGGVPEVIRENRTGFLLDTAADTGAVEDVLVRLVSEPDLRLTLGAQAQDWVRGKFTWARAANAVKRVVGGLQA